MRFFLAGLAGFVIGSFPSAIVLGRILLHGRDIRGQGSGNPGTANALKVLGPLPGAAVFLLDAGKGLVAAALAAAYLNAFAGWTAGAAAVAGHIFPVFAGFRGGKGLATGCGVAIALAPWALTVFIPVWAAVFLWRRQVPPASAVAIAVTGLAGFFVLPAGSAVVMAVGCGVIFWRHWPEARRFLPGGGG